MTSAAGLHRAAAAGLAALAALAATAPACAQPLDSARGFVRKLYGAYGTRDPDYVGDEAEAVFTPRLVRVIRRAEAATSADEAGELDGDPICDCQDAGGLKLARLLVKPLDPHRARAEVTLRFPDGKRTLRLDLAAVRGEWRVADVHTPDTPSLVRRLTAAAAAGGGPKGR